MDSQRLKEIMFDQKEVFNRQRDLIERDLDLDKYIQSGQVVVISGIRRCGKSSFLFLLKEKMGLAEEKYCYFNFDDERITPEISILEDIVNLHIEIYGSYPTLFFDEIHEHRGLG
ncbi:MAG: AAA family ATPase, partial [Cyclobacteriaceae bacterium]|nr:AAA family ATPase [Cyclobacteriaceae bacterium]